MKRLIPILFLLTLALPLQAQLDEVDTQAITPSDTQAITQSCNQAISLSTQELKHSSNHAISRALRWYDAHMNYSAVAVLMTVESSFVPFPSEVVIPPAVYVASDPQSRSGMKIWVIVLVGTLGALLGAYINYFLSRWLGRPIIYKIVDSRVGHLLLLNREKLERAENYFNDHGNISTLIGRLIPVVRQLISIPAGLAKMNILHFTLFTFIGAGVWNSILALIGYLAYKAADPSVIEKYSHQFSIAILALLVVAVIWFTIKIIRKRKNKKNTTPSTTTEP